jgi:hypothetical protein
MIETVGEESDIVLAELSPDDRAPRHARRVGRLYMSMADSGACRFARGQSREEIIGQIEREVKPGFGVSRVFSFQPVRDIRGTG